MYSKSKILLLLLFKCIKSPEIHKLGRYFFDLPQLEYSL